MLAAKPGGLWNILRRAPPARPSAPNPMPPLRRSDAMHALAGPGFRGNARTQPLRAAPPAIRPRWQAQQTTQSRATTRARPASRRELRNDSSSRHYRLVDKCEETDRCKKDRMFVDCHEHLIAHAGGERHREVDEGGGKGGKGWVCFAAPASLTPCSSGAVAHPRDVCGGQAELEDAVKELSTVPEGQELHLYLPDIGRTRYEVADLNRAIAPLLKKLPGEARIRPPFRGAWGARHTICGGAAAHVCLCQFPAAIVCQAAQSHSP